MLTLNALSISGLDTLTIGQLDTLPLSATTVTLDAGVVAISGGTATFQTTTRLQCAAGAVSVAGGAATFRTWSLSGLQAPFTVSVTSVHYTTINLTSVPYTSVDLN